MAAKRYAAANGSSMGTYRLMVCTTGQPPGECFWSGAGDGFVTVLVTSGFSYQHGVSY